MAIQAPEREIIRKRLEIILQEVAAIQRAIESETQASDENYTEKLLSCLGKEPIADYDFALDWQRFAA